MTEARAASRIPTKVEIGINSETNFYTGFSVNISSGGLFIGTHAPAEVGAEIPLSFSLPGADRVVSAVGVVRWRREFNPQFPGVHPGMGVKFTDLMPEDENLINDYLLTVREPYFHPEEDNET